MSPTATDLWRATRVLGQLDAREEEVATLLPDLRRWDADELYRHILASRVYTPAQRHLERLPRAGAVGAVLDRLQALAAEESVRRNKAKQETLAVLGAADSLRARVVKGLAVRERYPDPAVRHEGDIDLQVASWPAAVALASWLRQRGWQWDTQEFPWIKWSDEGNVYGQLTLVRDDNVDPYARVDAHIGPFSVGHAGLLPLTGWDRATVLGVECTVPTAEALLAMIAAHAVNDGIISMKDVNDVVVVLHTSPDLDWASVEELCLAAGARPALAHILDEVTRAYPDATRQRWAAPGYLHHGPEPTARRARRIARHAYLTERRRATSARVAARTARAAYRYYTADLRPRLDPSTRLVPERGSRGRGVCWRLLPSEVWHGWPVTSRVTVDRREQVDERLELVLGGGGAAVRVANDVFVPTVWGDVNPISVALARQLADQIP